MAQNAPPSLDVQDVQFKLHGRFTVFPEAKSVKSLVSLLAVASAKGLLFAGSQNSKELKVFKLKDIVDSKTIGNNVKVRVVTLPGEPSVLSCSCDGSMLAVNYISNNTSFLQIFQVDSFVTPTVNSLYNLPVAPENHTFALQLLWNPVITNNIALILTDGSVAMFTLNNGGQYDKMTLGKEHQVKSGCWSPKGKQIVFGFGEGKLQQFKPNLQPARAILCPPGIHAAPFDCIALHWLSTFQFAAIFLQRGQDMCPSLYIINAPKAGQPSYINYYDVCYSAPGPRVHQLSFHHISQWNILLVTSANGVEVGVLGTKDTGETPNWIQYTLLDEARIEMPLTESKDETYPLGFAFDTASSHQVVMAEKKLPVMPMIHVLSTHGHLISYNFLNLSPNANDICSPPPPLNDISEQFMNLNDTLGETGKVGSSELSELNKQNFGESLNDNTFTLSSNLVTSTPTIKDKTFGFGSQPVVSKPSTGFGFPATTAASLATTAVTGKSTTGFGFGAPNPSPFPQQFGGMTTGTPFGGFAASGFSVNKTTEANNQPAAQKPVSVNKNVELNKPLYTVPPTFSLPSGAQQQQQQEQQQQTAKTEVKLVKPLAASNKLNLNTVEIDEVVKQMIIIQMQAFENELRQIRQQSNQLLENIGSPNEMKSCTKQLNDLQEIIEQANDHEFEQDVQSLRHSMNESYAMLAECRTKLDLYNNPNLTRLSAVSSTDPTSRRQLAKLQAYVASNQNQLYHLNQLIDAQWSQYQDVVRRNSKNQMHIPCLDGIYQRMSKLKDLLARQRTKMNYIQTKLKQKGLNYKPAHDVDVTSAAVKALTKNSSSTMESLADSVLSMSLSKVVSQTRAKLSEEKLNAIRNYTKRQQQIAIIKPKRPDRVGLRSEVILETKLETERKHKEMAKKQAQQQLYQQQYQQQQQQFAAYKTPINMQPSLSSKMPQQLKSQAPQQTTLAKPTASKPIMVSSQPPTFITPTSSAAATLSFGGNSSFVKTSVSAAKPQEEVTKPIVATSTPFAGFGKTTSQAGLNFNPAKPITTSTGNDGTKENKIVPTPISFSAKVIGGNDAKPFANLGNKISQSNLVQTMSPDFNAGSATGFSAFTTTNPKTQDKDKTKKPEEMPKQFGFTATITTTTTTATSTPTTSAPAAAAFTGFPPSSKSTSITAPFSSQLFAANTSNNPSVTPFSAFSSSSSSPFSFTATVITSATTATVSNSATNNSNKAGNDTTTSIQSAAVISTQPAEAKTNIVATATTSTSNTTASVGSFSLNSSAASTATTPTGTISSAAPNAAISATTLSEDNTAVATSTSTNTPTSTEDPADSLLDSLNICQPTAKEAGNTSKSGNVFSGFAVAQPSASTGAFSFVSASGAGDGAKLFPSSTSANTGTTTSTGLSFGSAASTTPTVGNSFAKPAAASTTESTSTTESSLSAASSAVAQPAVTAAPTTKATATPSSFSFTAAAAASTPDSLFGSLSVSPATAAPTTVSTTATVTTAPAAGNIFSSGSSVFEPGSGGAIASTGSLFGGGPAIASTAPSLFASATPAATTAATHSAGSIFTAAASTTAQSAGSIFAGIPKPEQSVFNAANTNSPPAGTGLFAAAGAHSKSSPVTGGSIFGGGSTGFGGSAAGSIFGGGSGAASSPFTPAATANTAGSLFAAAAATNKPAEGSLFSSPTQQSPSSGGSIFSKSSFGGAAAPQAAGSIFQSASSGGFGASGGSIFGGSGQTNASGGSGGSLFGADNAATTPGFGTSNTSPVFGAFSQPSAAPAFASPPASVFGAPAQTAFTSPQQQSAFNKPLFGGQATFGSPQPSFGAQPTFGGAPTFGSPKGFGSFAVTSPAASNFGGPPQAAATAAPPAGNIFETLGSQDSGLSFGNLAHSSQTPQQKPSFGGSSFMNYRS